MTTESQKAFEAARWNETGKEMTRMDKDILHKHYEYARQHIKAKLESGELFLILGHPERERAFSMGLQTSRQHIIDKLQSPEMVERVENVIDLVLTNNGEETTTKELAREAIAAVLEGI